MAKYIIDLNPDCVDGEFLRIPIRVAGEDQWIKTKASLTPYTEPDRKAIENEVWEFARHLINVSPSVTEDIYWSINGGKGIEVAVEMSYQEAKARYDSLEKEKEKEKEEIHVGDEVQLVGGSRCIVWGIENGIAGLIFKDGGSAPYPIGKLIKTGRHFDEVERLLERMREE